MKTVTRKPNYYVPVPKEKLQIKIVAANVFEVVMFTFNENLSKNMYTSARGEDNYHDNSLSSKPALKYFYLPKLSSNYLYWQ